MWTLHRIKSRRSKNRVFAVRVDECVCTSALFLSRIHSFDVLIYLRMVFSAFFFSSSFEYSSVVVSFSLSTSILYLDLSSVCRNKIECAFNFISNKQDNWIELKRANDEKINTFFFIIFVSTRDSVSEKRKHSKIQRPLHQISEKKIKSNNNNNKIIKIKAAKQKWNFNYVL